MATEIGVLALQGDVSEHVDAFRRAGGDGVRVRLVRDTADIAGLDGLAVPGGESTTISRLIEKSRMHSALRSFEGGFFATCAGMVLMASEVDDPRVKPLSVMDIAVKRNAFGRQRESFEADIAIQGFSALFHAVFIRAPVVTRTGSDVEVLGRIDDAIIAIRSGRHFAFSFHPELGTDHRLHRMFLDGLL